MRIVTFAIGAITLALLPMAWCYIDASAKAMSEIGGLDLPMTFVVVDAETNKPIAGALIYALCRLVPKRFYWQMRLHYRSIRGRLQLPNA